MIAVVQLNTDMIIYTAGLSFTLYDNMGSYLCITVNMELYHVLTLVAPLGPGAGAWQALSVEEMGKTIAGFITTTMFLYSGDTGTPWRFAGT